LNAAKDYEATSEAQAASYDRNHPRYPYKSHGQWLKALYGLVASIILILFNGVRAFLATPFDLRGFFASYIGVSARYLAACVGSLGSPFSAGFQLTSDISFYQIPVFFLLILGYKIKRHGFNVTRWGPERSNDLRNTVQVASNKRKGRLEFPDKGPTIRNVLEVFRWVWVWMK
jgi:amino acid transporter